MIGSIKIYNGKGELKKEISQETALKIYNDNNKENWCLSPAEKKWWKGFKSEDRMPKPTAPRGLQPWIKREYKKREPKHKIICIICGKESMKTTLEAKFCNSKCQGVKRRAEAKKLYHKRKADGTLYV